MPFFDLVAILPAFKPIAEDLKVDLVPLRYACKLGTGKSGCGTQKEPVDDDAQVVQDECQGQKSPERDIVEYCIHVVLILPMCLSSLVAAMPVWNAFYLRLWPFILTIALQVGKKNARDAALIDMLKVGKTSRWPGLLDWQMTLFENPMLHGSC